MRIASLIKDKETVFDIESKQIYYSTAMGFVPLLFQNQHHPLNHFSEKNMLTITELLKLDNYSFLQENNGIPTVSLQNFQQETISTSTEIVQPDNGKTTDNLQKLNKPLTELSTEINFKIPKLLKTELQRIFTLKDYDFKIFSDKYTGTIQALSEQIEAYTFSSLYTTKKATIQNIEKDFETAKKHAYKGNVSELRKIKENTKNRRIKQTNNDKMNHTLNKKANSKKVKLTIVLSLITIFAILALIKQITTAIVSPSTPSHNVETKIYTQPEVKELINFYCQTKDTSLTQWRHTYILEQFPDEKLNQTEAISQIHTLAIYK